MTFNTLYTEPLHHSSIALVHHPSILPPTHTPLNSPYYPPSDQTLSGASCSPRKVLLYHSEIFLIFQGPGKTLSPRLLPVGLNCYY